MKYKVISAGEVKKMDVIGVYDNHKNKTKSEIEREMYYLADENIRLERVLREAEKSKKKLEKNKERFMELAIAYAEMKGDM